MREFIRLGGEFLIVDGDEFGLEQLRGLNSTVT
jgi:hypothetical protein